MTATDTQTQETDVTELDEDLVAELEGSAIGKAQLRHLQSDASGRPPDRERPKDQPQVVCHNASKRVRSLW